MSNSYTVYQIQPTKEEYDRINREGWGALQCPEMERMRAKQDLSLHGAQAYEGWMKHHFYAVAVVEADSLEDAFRLTNLWNDETRVYRMSAKMHSLSVGDVLFDGRDYIMVDTFGFKKVDSSVAEEVS